MGNNVAVWPERGAVILLVGEIAFASVASAGLSLPSLLSILFPLQLLVRVVAMKNDTNSAFRVFIFRMILLDSKS